MTIALESMSVEMPEVEGHPNRAGFRGVLTVVDAASQRPPSGSKGHRVVLTRGAAEAALPSLLGMALDYAPSFDRHDQRRKVGVITSAEIVGKNLEVGGFLYAKDFPDVVEEIAKGGRAPKGSSFPSLSQSARKDGPPSRQKNVAMRAAVEASPKQGEGTRLRASLAAAVERLRRLTAAVRETPAGNDGAGGELRAEAGSGLGMSYEIADVILADARARVWILTRVTFTGAAVLRRDKAAYEETWIELA
jgi:hypothetical protein